MAKRAKTAEEGVGDHPSEIPVDLPALIKVSIMHPKSIINGHVLDEGMVVELTQDEIDMHRAGGVALDDVADDDERGVYSVREPYVVPDSE